MPIASIYRYRRWWGVAGAIGLPGIKSPGVQLMVNAAAWKGSKLALNTAQEGLGSPRAQSWRACQVLWFDVMPRSLVLTLIDP